MMIDRIVTTDLLLRSGFGRRFVVGLHVANCPDTPVAGDFDGDGHDDLFAYKAGGTNDDVMWWGAARADFGHSTGTFSVAGSFTPLSGDFNGDGFDDIFWYKPGTGSDYVWFWFGRYGGGYDSYSHTVDVSDYTPFTGDFDGDGFSDIYWYRAGSGSRHPHPPLSLSHDLIDNRRPT